MFNFSQNKIYLIIFIIIAIIALLLFSNYYIKKIVKDEIKKIYHFKKRKQRAERKMKNRNKLIEDGQQLNTVQIPYQENMVQIPYQENSAEMENQSYIDPIGQNNSNIEYQNFNNSNSAKENILMRDIMDNTPNNRFQ